MLTNVGNSTLRASHILKIRTYQPYDMVQSTPPSLPSEAKDISVMCAKDGDEYPHLSNNRHRVANLRLAASYSKVNDCGQLVLIHAAH